jgi:hypothetical protein
LSVLVVQISLAKGIRAFELMLPNLLRIDPQFSFKATNLFRLSQKLLCASITRMDIGWTITISLWTVLVPPFVLN